jgi:hypothetical protein
VLQSVHAARGQRHVYAACRALERLAGPPLGEVLRGG